MAVHQSFFEAGAFFFEKVEAGTCGVPCVVLPLIAPRILQVHNFLVPIAFPLWCQKARGGFHTTPSAGSPNAASTKTPRTATAPPSRAAIPDLTARDTVQPIHPIHLILEPFSVQLTFRPSRGDRTTHISNRFIDRVQQSVLHSPTRIPRHRTQRTHRSTAAERGRERERRPYKFTSPVSSPFLSL